MKIIDEKLLKEFRARPRCELCGSHAKGPLDPHHWYAKRGFGGGGRLDLRLNLIGLCRLCHVMAESGSKVNGIAERCLEIVCKREACDPVDLVLVLDLLWRAPKGSGPMWFTLQVADWSESAKALLFKTLGGRDAS